MPGHQPPLAKETSTATKPGAAANSAFLHKVRVKVLPSHRGLQQAIVTRSLRHVAMGNEQASHVTMGQLLREAYLGASATTTTTNGPT
jgi:hypothetical protein